MLLALAASPAGSSVQAGDVICLQYARSGVLPVATSFLKLSFEGINTVVYSLLESIGNLICEQILTAGHIESHRCLLVHCSLGLHYLQDNFGIADFLIVLTQLINFLVDEVIQFLSCIKMDGIDFNFHINLLF